MLGLLAGAAAVAAGVFGAKKGADAVRDTNRAKELLEDAEYMFNKAKDDLEDARDNTQIALENLGKTKLKTWDKQFGRFVKVFSEVKQIKLEDNMIVENAGDYDFSENFSDMKNLSLKASEVLQGGTKALSSGALVGVAGYGGAMMLGTASTGTAISTLSGVAASNATLAWLGGGSLAAGGMGVAGGMAVLGGLVAGPALAVGGLVFSNKAKEKLAKAKAKYAEVENKVEEIKMATSMLNAIHKISNEFNTNITKMSSKMDLALDSLENAIQQAKKRKEESFFFRIKKFFLNLFNKEIKLKYDDLTKDEKMILMQAHQFANVTKILLETPLLNKNGKLRKECKKALKPAQKLLNSPSRKAIPRNIN